MDIRSLFLDVRGFWGGIWFISWVSDGFCGVVWGEDVGGMWCEVEIVVEVEVVRWTGGHERSSTTNQA